jgi:hypothetical protein
MIYQNDTDNTSERRGQNICPPCDLYLYDPVKLIKLILRLDINKV